MNTNWLLEKHNDRKILFDMILSAICKPATMFVSYIYVPIVLDYLGEEKYGIWSTILTMLSWIGYFDFGIGNSFRNKLAESLGRKDGNEQKIIASAYAHIALIMFFVAIISLLVSLRVNWNRVFGVDYLDKELSKTIAISFLLGILNFLLSICKNVLFVLQKAATVGMMDLATQTLNLFGVLIVIRYVKGNLFVIALVYEISILFVYSIANVLVYTRERRLIPNINKVDLAEGKKIISLGTDFFVVQICSLVLFSSDSLIISSMYGASDVTPYNTILKLFYMVIGVYTAFISPIWSAVTKAKTERRIRDLKRLIRKMVLVMLPFALIILALGGGATPISKLWLGRELHYTPMLIIGGAWYALLNIWTNTYGQIANGMGIVKEQIKMAVIQAVINIPLSIVFAVYFKMDSAGVLLGTDISLVISCIWLPILIHKKINRMGMQNENSYCNK